jgi:UDP-N-acetylmuramoylalanine--D-glutamate ligase
VNVDLNGKKVTVVGMGRTALSLVKLLLREGAEPFVTDSADEATLARSCAELDLLGVRYECGRHTERAFSKADLIVPSPGVSPRLDLIERARRGGAQVSCELEIAYPFCRSRILAVTGTNGKTTTTQLLHALVDSCGHSAILAGNNDLPFSTAVQADPPPAYFVLEVSSYQCELIRTFRPWIAAVLNVTPDHLSRHGTIEAYAEAKARLFANQTERETAVLNLDDPYVAAMAPDVKSTVWSFSLSRPIERGLWVRNGAICLGKLHVADVADTSLPGRHNLQNVLAALTMMYAGGFDWDLVLDGLRRFRGVEHRIEHVADSNGVAYYNDSKSTNIDSLRVALESFSRPIVLIAGGRGKGSDYRVLRELVRARVSSLVTIGEDAALLEQAFGDLVNVHRAGSMQEAVAVAAALARRGDVVLLSPACASFDMFQNFEHRGRVFKECVGYLQQGVAS